MLEEYLAEKNKIIENHLKEIIVIEDERFNNLKESMNYSLLNGGKRIRPILFLNTLELFNIDSNKFLDIACAIECVHVYSLIHDDLPSMDNDLYRRGKYTNHVIYGEDMAILAGDALLAYAFELIARQKLPKKIITEIILLLAKASGPNALVGGQSIDIKSNLKELTLEDLSFMYKAKTGALLKVSIEIAIVIAKVKKTEKKKLLNFATNFGLLFQITDDILDVIGNSKELGKLRGSDAKNNKKTYATILSVSKAENLAYEIKEKALDALSIFDKRANILRKLCDFLINRTV